MINGSTGSLEHASLGCIEVNARETFIHICTTIFIFLSVARKPGSNIQIYKSVS